VHLMHRSAFVAPDQDHLVHLMHSGVMGQTGLAVGMARNPLAAAMPESQLQEAVRRLCVGLGLLHFHVLNSKGCEPGWPDSVIIGRKVVYRVLKSEAGRLTREQQEVGRRLQRAGANWRVWRPSDLLSGQIARELTELADTAELFEAAR
jgi:hypothetical protein